MGHRQVLAHEELDALACVGVELESIAHRPGEADTFLDLVVVFPPAHLVEEQRQDETLRRAYLL